LCDSDTGRVSEKDRFFIRLLLSSVLSSSLFTVYFWK